MNKQPIDFLFSPYRRQMLAVLFLRPDERFHVRELERLTKISAGSLHRELKALAGAGLLRQERQGNPVLYQADRTCPIYEELASSARCLLDARQVAITPETRLEAGYRGIMQLITVALWANNRPELIA